MENWFNLTPKFRFLVSSVSIGFECPEDTLGSVTPDPEDCRSYYDCPVDQEPLHETCTKGPPATLFDDQLLICNYEDQGCNSIDI